MVAMKAIHRKLLRNLSTMKAQAFAIAMVIGCGVAMSVMSLSTLQSLHETRNTYYDRFGFADVFAAFKRGPLSIVDRVESIPGVAQVDARIVHNVNLIVEGLREPAVGRLISLPDYEQPRLNRVYLRRGRMPVPGRSEVVVGESFANAHGFQPGDTVQAIMNGRLRSLRMVGIVLSPEYIMEMNPGDILPDFERFGVFWMPRTEMEAAFDMDGACNDLSLQLMRGASHADVIRQLDNVLDQWGGVGSFDRDDQISHRFISDEMKQLEAMGIVAPAMFMMVAGFLLNIVMTRVIAMQREQIAALKAFGYSNGEVAKHYLGFVMVIVTVGVAGGAAFGIWMGHGLTKLYAQFYHFPVFAFRFDWFTTVLSALLCTAAGALGTFTALRSVMRLAPAEAMRPKSPGEYRATLLDHPRLRAWMPQTWRMVFREIRRRPVKCLMSVGGIAMAASIVVVGNFASDAMDFLVDFQFRQSQRQDLWVNLIEPTSESVISDFRHMIGVSRVESFRSLPVRIRSGSRSHRTAIMGLESERELYRILDQSGHEPQLAEDGLVISTMLAKMLQLKPGDTVTVDVLEGQRPTLQLRISGTVDDLSGSNAYSPRAFVNRIAQEGPLVSGVWLTVDSRRIDDLYSQLKSTPSVVGVSATAVSIESFMDTVGESQLQMQSFVIGFAIVIAAGVVYNTARVTLSERDRELATMRVLGFTVAEISMILLGELAVLTLAAIPLGMLLGYGLSWVMSLSLETDLFRIPLIVYPSTFGWAAIVVTVSSFVSGLLVRQRLNHLDLFAVLKGKE